MREMGCKLAASFDTRTKKKSCERDKWVIMVKANHYTSWLRDRLQEFLHCIINFVVKTKTRMRWEYGTQC